MNPPLVVVGDTLLDVDLVGRAGRLSPDAPVPVLDDLEEHARPGGAGLAAAMAAAAGEQVVLVTALGDDEAGRQVTSLLEDLGVRVLGLPYEGGTPVKKRIRAQGQSLLRLDSGQMTGTVGAPDAQVAEALAAASCVLVADYGRGVIAQHDLRALIRTLPAGVPVVWDPHPRGAKPLPGVRLVTPNQHEAALFAARLGLPTPDGRSPLGVSGRHASALQSAWQVQCVAVTLGAGGALLSYGAGAPVVAPAPRVQSVDTCGAGDMFAVTAALRLGAGDITTEAVQEAVWAAARYVASGGPSSLFPPGPGPVREPGDDTGTQDIATVVRAVTERGGVVVATGGCFDLLHAGHVATLREARQLGDFLVVCLNSDASVRRLKGPSRPLVPAADRARVLQAMEYVDAVVVFDEDTPVQVLRRIRPAVWAKGGDYAGTDVPEAAVLEEWGGQAVVLPYLKGRSTSELVRTVVRTSTRAGGDR